MKTLRNYFYSASYQLLTILLPIITVPIISRALGSTGVGVYAYTNSIVQEFTLVGTLGVSNYAVRQIAYVRDDKDLLSNTFSNIFFLQCLFSMLSLLVYIVVIIFSDRMYSMVFAIQTLFIISAGIDVSWLFVGLEDFKKTVLRNALVKVLGLGLVVIFVRTKYDLLLYATILSLAQFIGQLTMFSYLHTYVSFQKPSLKQLKIILVPIILMFIPQVANQIYTVVNKTILGLFKDKNQVGYFDMTDKISRIALQILIAIAAVMYPKIANLFAQKKHDLIEKYLNLSVQIIHLLGLPMMFGVIAVSKWFVPWFLGESFLPAIPVLQIMSVLIWIVPFGTVLENQYLLPTKHVKLVTIAVVSGALVSLVLNVILIPLFAASGAALTSIIAEGIYLIISLLFVKRDLPVRSMFKFLPLYLFNCLIMFFCVELVGTTLGEASPLTTLIQGIVGITVYGVLTFSDVKWIRPYIKIGLLKIGKRGKLW